jgi:hypothetical protein
LRRNSIMIAVDKDIKMGMDMKAACSIVLHCISSIVSLDADDMFGAIPEYPQHLQQLQSKYQH